MINVAANHGVQEIVIGMAHRGRLNVLCNIVGKTYEQVFSEFEGIAPNDFSTGTGDVKYHLGYSSQYETMDGKEPYIKLLTKSISLRSCKSCGSRFLSEQKQMLFTIRRLR
jgi:2-oxoglutarate dehydrogenase E1 component